MGTKPEYPPGNPHVETWEPTLKSVLEDIVRGVVSIGNVGDIMAKSTSSSDATILDEAIVPTERTISGSGQFLTTCAAVIIFPLLCRNPVP
jgi:hypothetical protein